MVETRKLKAKLVENGKRIADIAKILGVSEAAVYRRLKKPEVITVREVRAISEALGLSADEMMAIFFAPDVA